MESPKNPNPEKGLFRGVGVEVDIKKPDNFLKIKETLTRIGIAPPSAKVLYQSCHILHKRDLNSVSHYAILHFKELFQLDGKEAMFDDQDIPRRNAVVRLLEEWDLVDIVNPTDAQVVADIKTIKILNFKEKNDWELVAKYKIGKKRRTDDDEEPNGNR
jgi:hypothetical protein